MTGKIVKIAGLMTAISCASSSLFGCSFIVKIPEIPEVLPAKEEVVVSDKADIQQQLQNENTEKTTLYAPDGRSAEVYSDELTTYLRNGWFPVESDIKETGYYLAAPATDKEILAFATEYADEISEHRFAFRVGLYFDSDWDNPIKGPEYKFGYSDEYLWCEITDERIKSLEDLKEFWHMTFPKAYPPGKYMENYMEKGGKVYVAQAMGLGGGMWSSYVFDGIRYISDTEVQLTGYSYFDDNGDGKLTRDSEYDESEYMEEASLTMVLEDGRWKCVFND